jgi:hypothetical protein
MTQVQQIEVVEEVSIQRHEVGAGAFLNHLRFTAMQCRTKPQTELFQACALLQVSQSDCQVAHSEALMRCLGQALGQPARLLAPGTAELTFDERWLVQVGTACADGDDLSLAFLLRSRVAHENRRLITFLIRRIADCFPLI